jgi:hypothetical protein
VRHKVECLREVKEDGEPGDAAVESTFEVKDDGECGVER